MIFNFNPSYEVFGVSNGQEVLSLLATVKPLPHLLILDLWLPDLDADELIPLIRQIDGCKQIPIIIFSTMVKLQRSHLHDNNYIYIASSPKKYNRYN